MCVDGYHFVVVWLRCVFLVLFLFQYLRQFLCLSVVSWMNLFISFTLSWWRCLGRLWNLRGWLEPCRRKCTSRVCFESLWLWLTLLSLLVFVVEDVFSLMCFLALDAWCHMGRLLYCGFFPLRTLKPKQTCCCLSCFLVMVFYHSNTTITNTVSTISFSCISVFLDFNQEFISL